MKRVLGLALAALIVTAPVAAAQQPPAGGQRAGGPPVRTYAAMAQMKNAKGDKPGAIAALEKAIELDPNNAQARAQLDALKK
jgi:hypothetical protein